MGRKLQSYFAEELRGEVSRRHTAGALKMMVTVMRARLASRRKIWRIIIPLHFNEAIIGFYTEMISERRPYFRMNILV